MAKLLDLNLKTNSGEILKLASPDSIFFNNSNRELCSLGIECRGALLHFDLEELSEIHFVIQQDNKSYAITVDSRKVTIEDATL